ncbi:MAG TPA: prepilin-type N-terminal cleavage/methylation domain-containing protein [Steroidobacteraceae bacterium]|nr:prepilin-type N-terminal cleavage/methylation domain-containing protein [Steroidobacteraceae bacterium]
MSPRGQQCGVTLIELVVSIVVIAIAVSAVLGVFTLTSKNSADAMVRQQAVAIADAYLEEILLRPYVDPDGADGEPQRADFDDVDDYNGLNDAHGARDQFDHAIAGLEPYAVTVSVQPGSLGSVPNADVLRIDVTVTHFTGLVLRTSGYRANF